MTTVIDQVIEQFEIKKMIEVRENRFLSEILRLDDHLLKAGAEHFYLDKTKNFGCYFKLENNTLPKIIVDSASGDLTFESSFFYRKDHQEVNLFFGVNDNKLYFKTKDNDEEFLVMDFFHNVSKEFIQFLCCEEIS